MSPAWLSRRSLALHLVVVLVVAGCLAAFRWQLGLALGGETIAWIYTVEWPFFAGYAIYMWWRLLHDDPAARKAVMAGAAAAAAASLGEARGGAGEESDGGGGGAFDPYDDADPELAAYNRYLASLHESDRARRH